MRLYAILDGETLPLKELAAVLRRLIANGIDIVQLRIKDIFETESYKAAKGLVGLASKHGVPVVINDRPEIALALKADGVHLGRADVDPDTARKVLGPSAIIGCTLRSADEYLTGQVDAADYIAVGPVFRTPLKPGLKKLKAGAVERLCRVARVPVVAIGGITADNASRVLALGVDGLAFVRYISDSRKIGERMKRLKKFFGA